MKKRHRRLLFNLFAFSLLAVAVYLNMFRTNMNDKASFPIAKQNKSFNKEILKANLSSKTTLK